MHVGKERKKEKKNKMNETDILRTIYSALKRLAKTWEHFIQQNNEGFLYANALQHSAFVIAELLLYLKYRTLFWTCPIPTQELLLYFLITSYHVYTTMPNQVNSVVTVVIDLHLYCICFSCIREAPHEHYIHSLTLPTSLFHCLSTLPLLHSWFACFH